MAKGETGFSTKGRQPKKFERTPFAAGDYKLKMRGKDAEINKRRPKDSDDKTFSYVTIPFEALGTGKNGTGNRRVWQNFWLRQKPRADGSKPTDGADQLVGLARAAGEDIKLKFMKQNGETIVDPQGLVKWAQRQDGLVVKGHVGIERGDTGPDGTKYNDRNRIEYFIEKGRKRSEEDEAEEDLEDIEEEADEDEESDDEDTEVAEEDEEDDEDEDEAEEEDTEGEEVDEEEDLEDDEDEPEPKKRKAAVKKAAPKGKKSRR